MADGSTDVCIPSIGSGGEEERSSAADEVNKLITYDEQAPVNCENIGPYNSANTSQRAHSSSKLFLK